MSKRAKLTKIETEACECVLKRIATLKAAAEHFGGNPIEILSHSLDLGYNKYLELYYRIDSINYINGAHDAKVKGGK